ncbi:MAG TPA: hypothetical protein VF491_20340 [Vicinamibacterales bacterium]|jgi:hypothetical protein
MIAIASWFGGLWRLCTSPWIVAIAYAVLLLITAPIGAFLHRELPTPARAVTIEPGAGPVPDYDWLDEVTASRHGLLGSLSPIVIGVAAPFDNLDRFASGREIPDFAIVLSAGLLIGWAWLWGGVISRFAGVRRRFLSACGRLFIPVLTLNIAGVVCAILVYWPARVLLFDVLWPPLSIGAESTAFAWRVALTLLFLAPLAAITMVFDYARIALVVDGPIPVPEAIRIGVATVRANPVAAITLIVLSALLLAGLLIVYGAFEFIPGGSVPKLGRIIVLGQAYIIARIGLRLWNAAAQVALYQRVNAATRS